MSASNIFAEPSIRLNEGVEPSHNLADVAVALAYEEWGGSPYARALCRLLDEAAPG